MMRGPRVWFSVSIQVLCVYRSHCIQKVSVFATPSLFIRRVVLLVGTSWRSQRMSAPMRMRSLRPQERQSGTAAMATPPSNGSIYRWQTMHIWNGCHKKRSSLTMLRSTYIRRCTYKETQALSRAISFASAGQHPMNSTREASSLSAIGYIAMVN